MTDVRFCQKTPSMQWGRRRGGRKEEEEEEEEEKKRKKKNSKSVRKRIA